MTKEEKIKKLKSVLLCLSAHPDNEEHSEFADRIIDLKEIIESLQGIENNNGWIKIESEEDLPKENVFLECVCKSDKTQATHHFMVGDEKYVIKCYSHYKIILFKPPIY